MIAQEIEALGLPGITTTRDSGTKAVRYERLVPILIEAIKELEARVKTFGGIMALPASGQLSLNKSKSASDIGGYTMGS